MKSVRTRGRPRRCHDRLYLSRYIGKTEQHRGLRIGFLLEFVKRVFNLIQLVLSVKKKAALSVFEYVYYIISEFSLTTHPDVRLGIQFQDEFRHDSLLTVISHQGVHFLRLEIGGIRNC